MSGYITRPQAAKLAGVSDRTLSRHLKPDGKAGTVNLYDPDRVLAWAKTYTPRRGGNKKTVKVKQPPKVGDKRKFNKPISDRSAKLKRQPPKVWTTCDEQVAAVLSGKVAPLHVIGTAPPAWDWRTSVSFIGYGGDK